ncbi:RDD family protein [Kitasatospora sp. NPDC057198]|uniref:RDD family protein n=1 Tax=Kitasatospora sp. NPDC057198 TaxID=3346046 RepID=UPI00363156B8
MSYPPDPNNPYGQQPPPPGYGYPQQAPPAAGYGYPQQAPQQANYGYPQQVPPQAGYGYPQMPGTIQANNGYINIPHLGTVRIATMGQRFLARLLDGIVMSVVLGIAMAAGLAGMVGLANNAEDKCDPTSADYQSCVNDAGTNIVITALTMLAVIAVFLLVYEWLLVGLAGATVGKMALGLRVVRETNGQNPGLGAGFLRYILPVVGAVFCYLGTLLVYLSPFFDNSGKLQGWHDRAAGTVVIKK